MSVGVDGAGTCAPAPAPFRAPGPRPPEGRRAAFTLGVTALSSYCTAQIRHALPMSSEWPRPHLAHLFSQRLRLHYVDWGNVDAPLLVLVHGGRDHCRNWDWLAEELRRDWHIIAPDLRGHGDSEWSRMGPT